ncbi:Hypothetical predicted protein, partial [Pelobates cultripes]
NRATETLSVYVKKEPKRGRRPEHTKTASTGKRARREKDDHELTRLAAHGRAPKRCWEPGSETSQSGRCKLPQTANRHHPIDDSSEDNRKAKRRSKSELGGPHQQQHYLWSAN